MTLDPSGGASAHPARPAVPARRDVLSLLGSLSRRVLLAWGARSLQLPTATGTVHAYSLHGRGEGTFVLIHGLGANASGWVSLAGRLRAVAQRIVLVELPGHGYSEEPPAGLRLIELANSMREAIDMLIDERDGAVVLGNSLGGATALRYALTRPARVRRLILNSPAGAPLDELEVAALRGRFGVKDRHDARRFLGELMHSPPLYFRALERGLVAELGRPLVQRFLETVRPEDFFTAEELGKLAVPTVVLWGKSDRILPPSGLAFFRRALPAGTRFEEVEGAGHSIHLERPSLVARHLLEARDSLSK